jgi:hypothetical protein
VHVENFAGEWPKKWAAQKGTSMKKPSTYFRPVERKTEGRDRIADTCGSVAAMHGVGNPWGLNDTLISSCCWIMRASRCFGISLQTGPIRGDRFS